LPGYTQIVDGFEDFAKFAELNESQGRGLAAFGDVAKLVVERIGGGILNGAFERHTGIKDVDVAGTIGMAGDILVPAVADAYTPQPDEPFFDTLQRQAAWTVGLASVAVVTVGVGWVAWSWLKKHEDEGEE